jgi:hypothetical protein
MTNRSANGGSGRACLIEAKALSFTHFYQGVCGRHGTEEQRVTSGGLAGFSGGTGISRPISEIRNGERRPVSSRTTALYQKRGESQATGKPAAEVGRGRQSAKTVGKREETR